MHKSIITKIEKQHINFNGKEVTAKKLTVTTEILMNINVAWVNLQKSALLEFVCEGKVKFKPIGGPFPKSWKQFDKVSTKMLIHGFIPFGGIHTLYFEKIDAVNFILQTKEYNKAAKIWNHKITLKKLSNDSVYYEDEVIIYGGYLTNFITAWAKSFYKHRQNRWHLIAENNLQFK